MDVLCSPFAGQLLEKDSKMADIELSPSTLKPESQEEGSTSLLEGVGAGPRLMITKIVCENFKSYAGVKELGPFHKVCMCVCVLMNYSLRHCAGVITVTVIMPFSTHL